MNEKDAKFFRPLWIRVALTGVLVVWFAAEMIFSHDQMWIVVTAAGIAYCVWNFFLRFPKELPAADPIAGAVPTPDGPSPIDPLPPKQP